VVIPSSPDPLPVRRGGSGTLVAVIEGVDWSSFIIATHVGIRRFRTGTLDTGSAMMMDLISRELIGHRIVYETVQDHGAGCTPSLIVAVYDRGVDESFDPALPEYQIPDEVQADLMPPTVYVGELISAEPDSETGRCLVLLATESGVRRLWTEPADGPDGEGARGLAFALLMVVGDRVQIRVGGQPPSIQAFSLDL
jgi:hypothetical protein